MFFTSLEPLELYLQSKKEQWEVYLAKKINDSKDQIRLCFHEKAKKTTKNSVVVSLHRKGFHRKGYSCEDINRLHM